jgi:tetratricopeptide (TPR) repeat protein
MWPDLSSRKTKRSCYNAAMRARILLLVSLVVTLSTFLTAGLVYPLVSGNLDLYIDHYRVKIHRAVFPPEEILFSPAEQIESIVQATLQALAPASQTPSSPLPPEAITTPTLETVAATSTPFPTPTPTATPIPMSVALTGVRNERETRNNCGPATLSMALSFWGWQGNQNTTRAVLRPNLNVDDKNVMPEELVNYVHNYTEFKALVRVGGDIEIVQKLIAAGFPVIVEKGHITTGWIGHYILLTGYDEAQSRFLSQDALINQPDTPVPYSELLHWWQHFNYLYMVIYPPDREGEVMAVLGPQADIIYNYELAAQKARSEIQQLDGRPLFFAWYNLGASLAGLGDFYGAAEAFDAAYRDVYPNIRREDRPWRATWYQVDPYRAYYYSNRFEDVINLVDATLLATGSPVLEESFFWRGLAREASGDIQGALADFQTAANLNPNSTPALEQIQRIKGENSP